MAANLHQKYGLIANNFLDISPRIRYTDVFKDGGEKASIVVSRLVFSREKAGRFSADVAGKYLEGWLLRRPRACGGWIYVDRCVANGPVRRCARMDN